MFIIMESTSSEVPFRLEDIFMKAGKIIFNVIYWGLFSVLCFVMAGGKLIGCESFTMLSGSMKPGIPVGSIVTADTRYDYDSLKEGDIIIFRKGDTKVTHRIRSITEAGIETKGDANNASDGITTTKENYCGKILFHIPVLGFVISGKGKFYLIGGMVVLYIAHLLMCE